jgi:hypothetical protein
LQFAEGWRRPESIPNLAVAGCSSDLAHYSITPSLRVAGFEDENDDEGENEAPREWVRKGKCSGVSVLFEQ